MHVANERKLSLWDQNLRRYAKMKEAISQPRMYCNLDRKCTKQLTQN